MNPLFEAEVAWFKHVQTCHVLKLQQMDLRVEEFTVLSGTKRAGYGLLPKLQLNQILQLSKQVSKLYLYSSLICTYTSQNSIPTIEDPCSTARAHPFEEPGVPNAKSQAHAEPVHFAAQKAK